MSLFGERSAETARWRWAVVGGLKEESRMKRDLGFGAEDAFPKAMGMVDRWTSKRLLDLEKDWMTEMK